MKQQPKHSWKALIISLALIVLASFIAARAFDTEEVTGNVARIPIHGQIVGSTDAFSSGTTSSDDIIAYIEEANQDVRIKAIVLDINSPGGSAVASEEIMRAALNSRKPVVAWVRDGAASGAYWAASGCDHVIASPYSIVGSVGVISEFIQIPGLLERFNITATTIKAGEYKDIGSPYREMLPEERTILQDLVDKMGEGFIASVAKNRNLTNESMSEIRSAKFYLGGEAKRLGLVDELGGKQELDAYLERKIGSKPIYAEYVYKPSILDYLTGLKSEMIPNLENQAKIKT